MSRKKKFLDESQMIIWHEVRFDTWLFKVANSSSLRFFIDRAVRLSSKRRTLFSRLPLSELLTHKGITKYECGSIFFVFAHSWWKDKITYSRVLLQEGIINNAKCDEQLDNVSLWLLLLILIFGFRPLRHLRNVGHVEN
jgi:hypothetical protein